MPDYNDETSEVDIAIVITLALFVVLPVAFLAFVAAILPF